MRSEREANLAIAKYADTVRRICFVHLKNYHDVEDVFQDVFLKYLLHDARFESELHEKAWFIRVAINACKDSLKSFFKRRVSTIEELVTEPFRMDDDKREVLDAVLKLPPKYKDVIYLYYYEGYSALEIASLLRKNENTVYTWLSRARAQLKASLGGESFEE
ncbi:MAG: sigma-70 family RNA polymerase sigma factor [Coriobacteriales bacterium]|jgi:RNA polymerase sigma-70 factor (ECF subfamily)|nr:sigma-70 family RNA polymerase sigma factor [Coriobacteriales bacterium]